ncbi:hypothetical protein SNOG_10657 [Parastagonospora nodorum SN15]|uniref:Uncharacterized protein n=1 Tax=Phaeosphaeria nodorum (strain SN15 / ATCC MYA-4574 / FGSC 10173) TaxID=321614 RepID=Q0UC57_PHANO|nr:hypothetical protein SNOG_10657 [Parastagonospora nodorum SN15]EAT82051.1 hypothetical protein SNOG_10657 [Parastagonospora nodorum SN15]
MVLLFVILESKDFASLSLYLCRLRIYPGFPKLVLMSSMSGAGTSSAAAWWE